ncbi:MAG: hypothetical protein R3234_07820 [Thermoanaerobaculia bacterium]|nr:hypothetical protein [Thermoanaerobaculia bacterium]
MHLVHHRISNLAVLLRKAVVLLFATFLSAPTVLAAGTLPDSPDPELQARPGSASGESLIIQDSEIRLPSSAEPAHLRAAGPGWILSSVVRGERGSTIHLLLKDAVGELRSPPAPESRRGAEIRDPIPLIGEDSEFRGLVWLEGPDRGSMAVRGTVWNGRAWEEPRTLAAPGPGSQLALDATRLSDGSHLLVWSRFDGEDDEIAWLRTGFVGNRHEGEEDREIRIVHGANTVPDITPALLPTPEGALLAWSRYDGNDYRLQLARFSGDGWTHLGPLSDRGALLPRWQRDRDSGGILVYRDAAREGWKALRVEPGGTIRSRAFVPGPPGPTPRILETTQGDPVLVLPSGERRRLEWTSASILP